LGKHANFDVSPNVVLKYRSMTADLQTVIRKSSTQVIKDQGEAQGHDNQAVKGQGKRIVEGHSEGRGHGNGTDDEVQGER